jgi:hypothetical protein
MDPMISNLIIRAIYDSSKYILDKGIKDASIKEFSEIFNDTLNEISIKYNTSKNDLGAFYSSKEVCEHLMAHLEDMNIDQRYLANILINGYITLEPQFTSEDIIKDVFNALQIKLLEHPDLKNKLSVKYFTLLIQNTQKTIKNTEVLIEKHEDLKEILSQSREKPELVLSLYGNSIIKDIYWAVPIPKDAAVEVPLKYLIRNVGKKSTKKFEVFSRMPKNLHYGGLGTLTTEYPPIKEVKSGIAYEGDYVHTLCMSIDSLFPEQIMEMQDWVSIWGETSSTQVIDTTSKDGIDLKIKVLLDYSYSINFSIFQEDSPKIQKQYALSVIDLSKTKLVTYFQDRNRTYSEGARNHSGRKTFILNCCEASYLKKNIDAPIYKVKDYKTYEGTQDDLGYTIPELGIYPITKKEN